MKRITALSHPLIEVTHPCGSDFLREHGLTPGTYGVLTRREQDSLLAACGLTTSPLRMGGSAINSMVCARQLGVACTILGLAGDDMYGQFLHKQMRHLDIQSPHPLVPGARTGTCLALITSDGERTMRTCLGVATDLDASGLPETAIRSSDWLLAEGYFLTAGERNQRAIHEALRLARSHGVKVAFSASATFVIESRRDEILSQIAPNIDLLFANQSEATLLADTRNPEEALETLASTIPSVVITRGKDGAIGLVHGTRWSVPAFPPELPILDTTGAGDLFAGAFLAGILHGHPPEVAARGAARLASIIVIQHGTHLPNTAHGTWQETIQAVTSGLSDEKTPSE